LKAEKGTHGLKKNKLCCSAEHERYSIGQWEHWIRLCWQYCSLCSLFFVCFGEWQAYVKVMPAYTLKLYAGLEA
jgi:hypothetical protein